MEVITRVPRILSLATVYLPIPEPQRAERGKESFLSTMSVRTSAPNFIARKIDEIRDHS